MIYGEKVKLKLTNYYARRLQEETTKTNLEIIKKDVHALQYISNQTTDLCLASINYNIQSLKYVRNQSFELIEAALSINIKALEYIKWDQLSIEDQEYLKLKYGS